MSTPENQPPIFIVGVGSSAGGLEALNKLLSHIPEEADHFAIIIAQHLSPDYKSKMVELLNLHANWKVQVTEPGTVPKAKNVYINAPATQLGFKNGQIQVHQADRTGVRPIPSIDRFFQELAEDRQDHAIGVMLSGTGKDGTQGIITIKEKGGYTLAQPPGSSRHDSMPRSAINSGYCDQVIFPEGMADEIVKYIQHFSQLKTTPQPKDHWEAIFKLLTQRTQTDFSRYKRSTLERRIAKRLSHLKIDNLPDYYNHIQEHPAELDTLFQTMLIGVTQFFRDPSAFEALRDYLKKTIQRTEPAQTIRCWSLGCATGEEAYTLAIILSECLNEANQTHKFQVFATDIDPQALAYARRGIYPTEKVADVAEPLLTKYFTAREDGYEINKEIRQKILFSRHNVLVDPPFGNLDLICCRNVLIYFGEELQKEVFPNFHHVLKPNGYLFLGKSETIGQYKNLFHLLESKHRIYQRTTVADAPPRLRRLTTSLEPSNYATAKKESPSLNKLVEQTLVQTFDHPYIVVNEKLAVTKIKGKVQPYIELREGALHNDLLQIINSALHIPVQQALNEAINDNTSTVSAIVRFEVLDTEQYVRIRVKPLLQHFQDQYYYLVVFEQISLSERLPLSKQELSRDDLQNARIKELEEELSRVKQHAQTITEQYEASNEELQTLNEEFQSANEELKSTNEELETSNEELQSTNEELITANAELEYTNTSLENKDKELAASQEKYRLSEERFRLALSNANVGVFSQDQNLRYTWVYNPYSQFGFNDSMLGKSDYELFYNESNQLIEIKKVVLAHGQPTKETIKIADRHYSISIDPIIEEETVVGLTVVSVDITATINSQQEIQRRESLQSALLENYPNGMIFVFDKQLRYTLAGGQELKQFGLSEEKLVGRTPEEVFVDYSNELMEKLTQRYSATLNGEMVRGEEKINDAYYTYHMGPIYEGDIVVAGLSVVQNITERKRVQERLSRQQAILNSLVNNTDEGILAVNTDYRVIKINDVQQNFLAEDYNLELQEGDHLLEKTASVLPNYREVLEEHFARTFKGERFSFDHQNDEGSAWRFVEVSFTPLEDDEGNIVGGAHFTRNITQQVEESEVVKDIVEGSAQVGGKEYFEYLTEKLTQLFLAKYVYIGRLVNRNSRIKTVALRQEGKLISNFTYSLQGVPCQHVANKDNIRHFEKVSQLFPEDPKLQRWNAESYVGVPITAPSGESLGVIVLINDKPWQPVPEADYLLAIFAARAGMELVRQEAEERIRKKEQQLARISRNVPEMIYEYIVRKNGTDQFIYVSDAVQEIYEVSAKELLSNANLAWQAIHPDDLHHFAHEYQNSASKMVRFNWEGRIMSHQTKTTKWIKITSTPEKRENGTIKWYGIIDDISQQKQYEKELKAAKNEAERAAQAKEEFLATMSHEIRTPLNAIIGLSDLLIKQDPKPVQMDNLQTLRFSSKNLMNLINDVLDYSKIEANKVEITEEEFDLRTLVRSLEKAHVNAADQRDNTLLFQIDDTIPDYVCGDEGKLSQVLNNLLSNAIKFTENGTVTFSLETVRTQSSDNSVTLSFSVSDTGIGIADDKIATIFEKFTQADSTTVRKFGGTGLGLAISKRLLILMGSDIEVKSTEGQGSTFSFVITLQLPKDNSDRVGDQFDFQTTTPNNVSNLKLLIVEDEAINRMVLQQYLQNWDIEADEVENGEMAIEKVHSGNYDLVLMDIRMPVMDGYKATEKIRSLPNNKFKELPIIALTADVSSAKQQKKAGLFQAFITKPFNPDELKDTIYRYLEDDLNDVGKNNHTGFPALTFAEVEGQFKGNTEKISHFYKISLSTVKEYDQAYRRAAKDNSRKQLEGVIHKARLLFSLLGLNDFLEKLQEQTNTVEDGLDDSTIKETTEFFGTIIQKIEQRWKNLD
jgi:PAS domain S-box-containing protein